MDFLIPVLAITTLLIAVGLAYVSKKQTEAKMDDPNAEKSVLASDTPDH